MSPLRAIVYLGVAGGGALLAWVLAGSVVPDGLSLPEIDVDATFGRELVDQAERYERFLYVDYLLAQLVLLATLAVYARHGARFARESAAGPIGTGMLLGMLGLAIAWLTLLPFSVAALWWDRRNGVSEVGYLEWIFGDWLALGGTFVASCLALLVVMALARWLGSWWWIPGAGVFAAIAIALVFVGPYLVTGLERPVDPELQQTYDRFEREQGVDDIPLRIEEVSGDTSQANAYAFGLGPSARIVLWDTLLDGRFTDREVNVVLAHELGHHSSDHILESIGWFGLFALPGSLALVIATRRRGGMGEPAAVPLALLVTAVVQLALAPAQNQVSRHMEGEADWKALETTGDPVAAEGLFRGFSSTSLGDPSPPTWAYVFLQSHPTLSQRVAMAKAWASESPRVGHVLSHPASLTERDRTCTFIQSND
ncbi:MAG: M48 family metalloprotease [Actinobacteria bacterium]|nr:M48 family metalloprotease [Actinomycetota bacterium]